MSADVSALGARVTAIVPEVTAPLLCDVGARATAVVDQAAAFGASGANTARGEGEGVGWVKVGGGTLSLHRNALRIQNINYTN